MSNKKLAAKPTLGSFFILGEAIYYNKIKNGLDHLQLWKIIVTKSGLFDKLVYENKIELIHAHYATDRGRATWTGNLNPDETPDFTSKGQFVLYGTPNCAKFEDTLKSIFGLGSLPEDKLKIDWKTDSHYKIMESDKNTLKDMIRLLGGMDKLNFKNTKIARIVENTVVKKVVAKLKGRV